MVLTGWVRCLIFEHLVCGDVRREMCSGVQVFNFGTPGCDAEIGCQRAVLT